jgi:hypothetical protein
MKAEAKIQNEIVMWFKNNYCLRHHNPRCCIFSVPNERNNAAEVMRMKGTGLMKGVADLVVVLPNKIIFVECKNEKGLQSEAQSEFAFIMHDLGFDYFLVRSLDEFKGVIKSLNK